MRHVVKLLMLAGLSIGWTRPASAQASLIILARHAEKSAPTGDVGLTAVGEARARDLATALAGVKLGAIITTQYIRTRLTAEPTAQLAGLHPFVLNATGNLKGDAAQVAREIDGMPPGYVVLVVGHSNTLAPIIAALGGPAIADLCDDEYSTLLILARGPQGTSLIRTRFGAAEPSESSQCTP